MTIEATIAAGLASIASAMPSISISIRYAGPDPLMSGTIINALCTGLERIRVPTDEGIVDSADGIVRYVSTAEPAAWGIQTDSQSPAINGQVVELQFSDSPAWRKARVIARKVIAGMVRLTLEAEHP